jgi:[acyl-carrier-protein] S-malonyltransferase
MARAFLFPGQGSQTVGMGKAVAEQFAVSRAVFDEADAALGFKLSALCFEGPESDLMLTANSQPAILTVSIAVLRALQETTGIVPAVVAGHSLGEYSALVCAGALSFADAVRTVRARGQLMQEAVPAGLGSMAAIGAAADVVDALCREAAEGQVLAPANYNTPNQTVIAGHKEAVQRAVTLAGSRQTAAKELKVSAPFHCALMQPAADRLKAELAKLHFTDAKIQVVGNVDAAAYTQSSGMADRLVRQVTSPVRWEASVRELVRMGVKEAFEIGPGRVLTQMLRRIDTAITGATCESPADIEGIAKRP